MTREIKFTISGSPQKVDEHCECGSNDVWTTNYVGMYVPNRKCLKCKKEWVATPSVRLEIHSDLVELTDEEVQEIIKQNSTPIEEKKVGLEIKNRFTGSVIFQSTKTTWKEAVEEGKANLYGANLYGADLCGANLRGADLYGADLCGANLRGANLRGADLCEADLCGADLYGADLREADLYGADLCGANMQNVKFFGKDVGAKIKKEQLNDFIKALGVIIED